MNDIEKTINFLKNEIEDICNDCKRSPDSVKILAVSKTHSCEEIMHVYDYGIRDFGENKVQEMIEKREQLPKDINWHLIGHLQRNKVKYITEFVNMIHSVDSLRLCKEIEKEAALCERTIPILLEVNISGEESKYGLKPEEVKPLINEICHYKHISVKGLMTIAPFVEDDKIIRDIFFKLKELFLDINSEKIDNVNMNVLSMGMSHDYRIAISEGANIIRVGSLIFGSRNYD